MNFEIVAALLKECALCDSCLGRQFAMLGHGLTNEERGRALKLACVIEGSRLAKEEKQKGIEALQSLATKGFSEAAAKTLDVAGVEFNKPETKCQLCGDAYLLIDELAKDATKALQEYSMIRFSPELGPTQMWKIGRTNFAQS